MSRRKILRYVRAATTLRAKPDEPPSLRDLKKLFRLKHWDFEGADPAAEDARRRELAESLGDSTRDLSYEDLLEVTGCAVVGRSEARGRRG